MVLLRRDIKKGLDHSALGLACESGDVLPEEVGTDILPVHLEVKYLEREPPLQVILCIPGKDVGEIRQIPASLRPTIQVGRHLEDGHHRHRRYVEYAADAKWNGD